MRGPKENITKNGRKLRRGGGAEGQGRDIQGQDQPAVLLPGRRPVPRMGGNRAGMPR